MKISKLYEITESRQMISSFAGYNHNDSIGTGEFYDMSNLSTDAVPVLSVRHQRGRISNSGTADAIIAKDRIYYCSGKKLMTINNGVPEQIAGVELSDDSRDKPKKMVSFGAYILIFPDGIWYNTSNPDDTGGPVTNKIEDIVRFEFSIYLKGTDDIELIQHTDIAIGTDLPETDGWFASEDYTHGARRYFLDISTKPATLYYSNGNESSASWEVKDYCTCINAVTRGIQHATFKGVKQGDIYSMHRTSGVFTEMEGRRAKVISGSEESADYTYIILDTKLYLDMEDKTVQYRDGYEMSGLKWTDSIWATKESDDESGRVYQYGQDGTPANFYYCSYCYKNSIVRIEKDIFPRMDIVTESGNRLWGCRYGENYNGDFVNEIYASKLGDFKSWDVYAGISTDSYTASLGSDGPFTGAITYQGNPIFFKQKYMHRVYGSYPSQYQVVTTEIPGVEQGSERSLTNVNGVLYYVGNGGVYACDGSTPIKVSDAFGKERYSNCYAGVLGDKYYLSVNSSTLFVRDTTNNIWTKENGEGFTDFAEIGGELYMVSSGTGDTIHTVNGTGTVYEKKVSWTAETGLIGIDSPDKKYITRIQMRILAPEGTRTIVQAQYDGDGEWCHVATLQGRRGPSFSLQLRTRRCDYMKLRFIGEGDVKIYSVTITSEGGSEK